MILGTLIALHVLAAVVWVGGMFFAHMVARPALSSLEPPARLRLWSEIFPRFFAWVWLSMPLLLLTGYGTLFLRYGGFAKAPISAHLMQGGGLAMAGLFVYLYAVPFARFRRAVAAEVWPEAVAQQAVIRRIVTINLGLGLAVSALAVLGPFWS